MRLLLDERTTQSFLHVLDEATNFFSPLPGPIRKVFDIELGEVSFGFANALSFPI